MDQLSTSVNDKKNALNSFQNVTVIGAGAIGSSWTALFLANGLHVTVNDPRTDLKDSTLKSLDEIIPSLKSLGYDTSSLTKNLSFEKDLATAVKNADVIQENGPENVGFKQDLYAKIELSAKPSALILSSSSSIPATLITAHMKSASRVLIGHPFNPPHLIPLVEVVPGVATSKEALEHAMIFYTALGKSPILIEKEISGFVANRLQAALLRESVHLVKQGVVTMENLDLIVSSSIGLRWASAGPFKTFHLGGGPGGLAHFLEHLGPGMDAAWKGLGTPTLDEPTVHLLIDQVNNCYAKVPFEKLAAERDEQQVSVMKALGK